MKKIFIVISCLFCIEVFAQVGVTIYNTKGMGIGFPVNKRFFGEFKAYSNMYLSSMRMEVDICINIQKTEYRNIYIGIGTIAVPFEGEFKNIAVPLGLQISPFENFRNLAFVLEMSPEIYEDVYIRTLWGIRYNFLNDQKEK